MKKRKQKMDKPITSIGFDSNNKKQQKVDGRVMSLINEFATLNEGIPPKALLRNFLLRVLPLEIRRLRSEKKAS
jgi:hypothetical protein